MKNRARVVGLSLFCVYVVVLTHDAGFHPVAFADGYTCDRVDSPPEVQRKQPAAGGSSTVTLVSRLTRPDYVAVDQMHYYLITNENQVIVGFKRGGSPTTLFETSGSDSIKAVAADGTGAYVLTSKKLVKVDPDTHDASELAETESNDHELVLDESSVYWIGRMTGGKGDQLIKIDKKGGMPTALATEIYAPQSGGLAIDQTTAYWLDYADDTLKRVSKKGGTTTTVMKFRGPQSIAVDDKYIYAGAVDGSIKKFDKSGSTPQMTVVSEHAGTAFWIVCDQDRLYYSDGDRIMSVGKNGGASVLVTQNQGGSFRFAMDACCIYWSGFKTGRVLKTTK